MYVPLTHTLTHKERERANHVSAALGKSATHTLCKFIESVYVLKSEIAFFSSWQRQTSPLSTHNFIRCWFVFFFFVSFQAKESKSTGKRRSENFASTENLKMNNFCVCVKVMNNHKRLQQTTTNAAPSTRNDNTHTHSGKPKKRVRQTQRNRERASKSNVISNVPTFA